MVPDISHGTHYQVAEQLVGDYMTCIWWRKRN